MILLDSVCVLNRLGKPFVQVKMRWRVTLIGVLLTLVLVELSIFLLQPRGRNRIVGRLGLDELVQNVTPGATPFDRTDPVAATRYRNAFANGYSWAWGQPNG